ncbi:response regulator [Pelagicoccus sp. SDUM812002]|uniref:response regulator n=1 Tax=Pelagicoccus sp. SDUM812002 TaxID=3041266 RepID=UPI00280CE5D6|nr:response regulator [Pelagicoccus sp. SDUM812002]MDQ8184785.1 response regulator [Pelagicoccus sp. SDUM812002]
MKSIVIDDSRTVRKMLCHYMQALNFHTLEAEDGCEALACLGEEDPACIDLALIDWDMPRMTGIEFLREIRSCEEYDHLKVMMVTSHNKPEDLMKAIELGADEFLMKPFDEEMLQDKLRILGMLN